MEEIAFGSDRHMYTFWRIWVRLSFLLGLRQQHYLTAYRSSEPLTWVLYNLIWNQRTHFTPMRCGNGHKTIGSSRIHWSHHILHCLEVAGLMDQWNEFLKVHLKCELGNDNLQRCYLPTTKEGFSIDQSHYLVLGPQKVEHMYSELRSGSRNGPIHPYVW